MIKELTPDEATRLRDLVKIRFSQSPFNGAGFRTSQFKGSYQRLADDITASVDETRASVTTYRLRKLFYYTDPEICAPDKLGKPSFGDDFITALFKYIETPPANEEEHADPGSMPQAIGPESGLRLFTHKWRWRAVGAGLLLAAIFPLCHWLQRPSCWEENFDDVSVEGLRNRGWKIFDYDSVAFSKQMRKGALTLFTYPGDYWVKNEQGETPFIKNMLVRRTGRGRYTIATRIAEFDPGQNWQQAGIYLFGSARDPQNFFRVVFHFCQTPDKHYKYINSRTDRVQSIQNVICHNGRTEESGMHIRYPEFEPAFPGIGLSIEVNHRKVKIGFSPGNAWASVSQLDKMEFDLPFEPVYVGLAACQGITNDKLQPLNADTIPVFFEYVKVEPGL